MYSGCSEAVKLVLEQGIQQSLAARRLSIPEGTLATWVAAAKSATTAASVPGTRLAADLLLGLPGFVKNWQKPAWSEIS